MYGLVLLLAACLCGDVLGFSSGPPVLAHPSICTTMLPNHGVGPSTDAAPYTIAVNTDHCYKHGMTLEVTVSGTDEAVHGLFIQARPADMKTVDALGQFSTDSATLRAYDCFQKTNSSLGHYQVELIEQGATTVSHNHDGVMRKRHAGHVHDAVRKFTWTCTDHDSTQDIMFMATVVKQKTLFWTHIHSAVLSHKDDCKVGDYHTIADDSQDHHHHHSDGARHACSFTTLLLCILGFFIRAIL